MIFLKKILAGLALAATVAAPARAADGQKFLEVSAWLPTSWDRTAAWESLDRALPVADEINPFWFRVRLDGTIERLQGADEKKFPTKIRAAGVRLVPTVSNAFSPERAHAVLVDADIIEWHAETLRKIAADGGFDGLELDYEAVAPDDREGFSLLVENLAKKLHRDGRTLALAVQPKTSDTANWNGPGGTDFERIGAAADRIKIMAYDENAAHSRFPGPVGSLPWVRRALTYATKKIPAEKVVLGIPLYGYDWGLKKDSVILEGQNAPDQNSPSFRPSEASGETSPEDLTKTGGGLSAPSAGADSGRDDGKDSARFDKEKAAAEFLDGTGFAAEPIFSTVVSRTFSNIGEKILGVYAPAVSWSPILGENSLRFLSKIDGNFHEVWFADGRSVSRRLDLAREFGLAGVAFWRLGGEDPRVWDRVAEKARGIYEVAGFADVAPGTRADHATRRLLAAGLVSGFKNLPAGAECRGGTGIRCGAAPGAPVFRPEAPVSRAEFLKFVFGAFPLDPAALGSATAIRDFADVSGVHWAKNLVRAARGGGLVRGFAGVETATASGEFRPEASISRAGALAIWLRAGGSEAPGGAGWAAATVVAAENLGIVRRDDPEFASFFENPAGPLTRAEAAILAVEKLGWD